MLRYCQVLQSAAALAGRQIDVMHLVGGGSQNALMRLMALGDLGTLDEVRAVAMCSSRTTICEPRLAERTKWRKAAARLEQVQAVSLREE